MNFYILLSGLFIAVHSEDNDCITPKFNSYSCSCSNPIEKVYTRQCPSCSIDCQTEYRDRNNIFPCDQKELFQKKKKYPWDKGLIRPEHSLEQYSASLKMLLTIPNVKYRRLHRMSVTVPTRNRLDFLNEHVQLVHPIVKQNIASSNMWNLVISTVQV